MKKIKFLTFMILQLALVQLTLGQATLDNGRAAGLVPSSVATDTETATNAPALNEQNQGDYPNDFDVPRQINTTGEDIILPLDFDNLRDELMNSMDQASLEASIAELRTMFEELKLENSRLRNSLSNCCTASELGLGAQDAYLLQNAPNPFQASSNIQYFVPDGLSNVQIEIFDVKGELLKTVPVEASGYGQLDVDGRQMLSGTYIYTLSVDGQTIDSKVMILKR